MTKEQNVEIEKKYPNCLLILGEDNKVKYTLNKTTGEMTEYDTDGNIVSVK